MKNAISTKKQTLSFNIFRAIAICAIIGVISLTILLWAEALMPGEKSAAQSSSVVDNIKDKVDVFENPAHIDVSSIQHLGHSKASFYVGEKEALQFAVFPENATNQKLTFSSRDTSVCTVNSKGVVSYLAYGSTYIDCKSKDNPNVSCAVYVFCSGYKADESVTDLRLTLNATPASADRTSINEGNSTTPIFQDQNGRVISMRDINLSSSNPSVLSFKSNKIYGIAPGTATLRVVCQKAGLVKDIEIAVLPTEKIVPTGYEYISDTITLVRTQTWSVANNISAAYPAGAKIESYAFTILDTSVARNKNGKVYACGLGKTTITVYPVANPSNVHSFEIVVVEPWDDVHVAGDVRIVSGQSYQYHASFTSGDITAKMTDIVWEVKGFKAEITQDGLLTVNSIGKVKVRVVNASDPTQYQEIVVRVSLYANFHTFVRKIFGHFSAFAVLGFGLATVFFLLLRPRILYAPCALASGFFVAMMSEIFQLPIFTANRGPSWVDVMLDTCGVAAGIGIATLVIAVYLLVVRFKSKRQTLKIRRTLSMLNSKTLFLSPKKTKLLMDTTEYTR